MLTNTEMIKGLVMLAGVSALAGCSGSAGEMQFDRVSRQLGMLVNMDKCIGCTGCVMACKVENGTQQGTYWCNLNYKEEGTAELVKRKFKPVSCNHCGSAPCVYRCPTGASHHKPDGTVQINTEICTGCHTCVNVCPYGMRHFNYSTPEDNPSYALLTDIFNETVPLTPFESAKADRHKYLTAGKCTFCADRRADGRQPACVETCPTGARIFGRLDDPDSEIAREIVRLNAKPIELENSQPSIYYAGEF